MSRSMKISLVLLATCQLAMFSGAARADECLADHDTGNKPSVGKKDSWAIERQQARNTWPDYIWRGRQFQAYCEGPNPCVYTFTKSITTGYQYGGGVEINLKNIPIIGGALGVFSPSGNYSQNKSYTNTFSINTQLNPGWSAYPVQAVIRRWVSGNFRGMDDNTGRVCQLSRNSNNGHVYRWNGDRTFGYWSANKEVGRTHFLHTWKGI